MIKFKAKHLVDRGYTLHLPGNDGENELIIVTSWGQDGSTPLMILSTSCDGGPIKVLHNSNATRAKKTYRLLECVEIIRQNVNDWVAGGIAPTVAEMEEMERQVGKLTKALIKIMGAGAPKDELKSVKEAMREAA